MFEEYAKSKAYNSDEEWHRNREFGIGGSESSIILENNRWKDINTLWKEKKGIIAKQDLSNKPSIILGNLLEPIIREKLRIKYRKEYEVKELKETFYSIKFPFMFANLDGVMIDKTNNNVIGLEIKTTTVKNYNDFLEKWEELYIEYYIQIQHYMAVTGIDKFLVHVMALDWNKNEYIKEFWVNRDEEDIEVICEKVSNFWKSLKENKAPSYKIKFNY